MKKCPYCGRRVDYSAIYRNKKRGSFTCKRCEKESKLKISNKMMITFVAVCLLVVLFMILWVSFGLANNLWGFVIVATALLIFNFATPSFIELLPLKKYVEAGVSKEEKIDVDSIGDSNFVFNREAFDRIKRQKEMGMKANSFDVEDDNKTVAKENMVHVIEDVKEGHISSSDGPLQKINRQPRYNEEEYVDIYSNKDVKQYVPKKKQKPDGSKYTANRRF